MKTVSHTMNFDAVAFQRMVRERMSKDMEKMTFAERQAYIHKKAETTLARIAKTSKQ